MNLSRQVNILMMRDCHASLAKTGTIVMLTETIPVRRCRKMQAVRCSLKERQGGTKGDHV